MHKKLITIKWQADDGELCQEIVLAKDTLVKNKEEFLLANTRANENLCIRLDKISLLKQGT